MKALFCILLLAINFLNSFSGRSQQNQKYRFEELFSSYFERKAFTEFLDQSQVNYLALLLGSDVSIDSNKYRKKEKSIHDFIVSLARKELKYKSEKEFLEYVFKRTHTHYLKHYKEIVPFDQVLKNGAYNCVSGTALYAYILGNLGYTYQVYETPTHAFLTVNLWSGDKILFESTDPKGGFITDTALIKERELIYSIPGGTVGTYTPNESTIAFNCELCFIKPIKFIELIGLQYYNSGIENLNKGNYPSFLKMLKKAYILYPSERIKNIYTVTDQVYQKYTLSSN